MKRAQMLQHKPPQQQLYLRRILCFHNQAVLTLTTYYTFILSRPPASFPCVSLCKKRHTHTHRVVHQCGLECQTTGGRGDGARPVRGLANLSHTHHTTCSPAPETVIGCSSVTPPPAARPLLLVSTGGCLEEPRCDFCETRGRRSRLRIRFPARFTRSACNACDGRLFVEADGPNIKK